MAGTISGGCACGAIRYRTDAEPIVMLNCHCRDCQRATGGGYAAIVVVPKASVTLDGAPKFHKVVADSGNAVERAFCPSCGSPLAITLEKMPEIFGVLAGSLDDPARYQPKLEVFTASAQPWCAMADGTKKFPKGPA
jgi:hypothetical protein